jgi:hypothetical protein
LKRNFNFFETKRLCVVVIFLNLFQAAIKVSDFKSWCFSALCFLEKH